MWFLRARAVIEVGPAATPLGATVSRDALRGGHFQILIAGSREDGVEPRSTAEAVGDEIFALSWMR